MNEPVLQFIFATTSEAVELVQTLLPIGLRMDVSGSTVTLKGEQAQKVIDVVKHFYETQQTEVPF